MQAFSYFVSEFPLPAPGEDAGASYPRFGVWQAGDGEPAIVATGDNVERLCQFFGVDPRLVKLRVPDVPALGND